MAMLGQYMPYGPNGDSALLALATASAAAKSSAVMALPSQAAPSQVHTVCCNVMALPATFCIMYARAVLAFSLGTFFE